MYEGDNVTLRCTQFPGYAGKLTAFYKDDMVIQDWSLESELLIENIDNTSNQRYKCTKQVKRHLLYYLHTAEVTFSAQGKCRELKVILSLMFNCYCLFYFHDHANLFNVV